MAFVVEGGEEVGPDGVVKKRRKKRKKEEEVEDEPEEDPFANLSPEEREKAEKERAKMSQKGSYAINIQFEVTIY